MSNQLIQSESFPNQVVKDLTVIVKVYYNSELQEYVAKLYYGTRHYSAADCFDYDRVSILGTARHMLTTACRYCIPSGF